jgi:hypothetical protein
MATFIPGIRVLLSSRTAAHTARYCYCIWMRHLVMAAESGLPTQPEVIAELGPGDSLGMGLTALLCGVEKFFAFDVVEYANVERNLEVFEQLVGLLGRKEDIPDAEEFPKVWPRLKSYAFPQRILTDERLNGALKPSRIARIRQSIRDPYAASSMVSYTIPWHDAKVMQSSSVDMVYSQAVMQYVDDLPFAYRTFHQWLKPGGFMSHQIDLSSHGTAQPWNGHWRYSDVAWKLIRGKRPYFLNREPHSVHVKLLRECGFDIVCDLPRKAPSALTKRDLSTRFRGMLDEDLTTSGAFIQAVKRAS